MASFRLLCDPNCNLSQICCIIDAHKISHIKLWYHKAFSENVFNYWSVLLNPTSEIYFIFETEVVVEVEADNQRPELRYSSNYDYEWIGFN